MANVKVIGDCFVITSSVKLEDIQTIEKYRPEVLVLRDEEKEPVFRVGVGNGANAGEINAYGVSFANHTNNPQGFATATLRLGAVDGDLKEYVADIAGAPLMNLKKIEERIPAALLEIAEEKEAVLSMISFS